MALACTASALGADLAIVRRAQAAYLGLAIGDALGATVEFMTPREIAAEYGVHDRIRGGGWLRLRPGQVTDDTGMALALGEAILSVGGIDAEAIARSFDAWMRSRPVDIGHTVRRGILHYRQTGQTEVPYSEHDAGNGAAMRVLPVALATFGEDEGVVRAACRLQAHVTHHHPLSDAACETLALMLQDALRGEAQTRWFSIRLHELIARHPQFEYQGAPRLSPTAYVVDTLQAVFQSLAHQNNFHDILVEVVNRGGDADTTGAIAGMLAGARYGLEGLPRRWLDAIDPTIRRACESQATELLARAPLFKQHAIPSTPSPLYDNHEQTPP